MRKLTYVILFSLSLIFIVYSLNYVSENNITKKDILEKVPETINFSKVSEILEKENISTETISNKIKETKVFTYVNETEIKENFMIELQDRRNSLGKKNIQYSKSIEKKAQKCAEDYENECLIEYYQNGIGWQIPWYTDVIGCGNAFGNKNNPDCLMDSLQNDDNFGTDIYNDILKEDKIGIGVYHIKELNEISYWIIIE